MLDVVQHQTSIAPFGNGDTDRAIAAEAASLELKSTEGVRRQLYELQGSMAESGLPSVDCPLQHSYVDGVYVRTIFIPAGTVILGKIHKHSHANVLSQGEVSVMTEGGGLEHFKGPLTMVSPAGCKRAVYAHTDTTWTTIHSTDETDLDKIEKYVIAETYAEYEQFKLTHARALEAA